MGCAFSSGTTTQPTGPPQAQAAPQPAAPAPEDGIERAAAPPAGRCGSSTHGTPSRQLSRGESLNLDTLTRVHELQQELALLGPHPLLALPEAAEVLRRHLAADLVGMYVFLDAPPCAALVAAHGAGAQLLEASVVVTAPRSSPMQLLLGRLGPARGGRLVENDAETAAAEGALPPDFEALYRSAGLRSLAAISVGSPGGQPLGALLLGMNEPGAFDQKWSAIWMAAASTGLLQHVRHACVAQAAHIIRTVDDAADPVAAISVLLRAGVRMMWHSTNIAMGVRLAIAGATGRSALVFETACGGRGALRESAGVLQGDRSSASKSAVLPTDVGKDVTVKEIPMANTLLQHAIAKRQARFIKDCAAYLQNCPHPAHDVFTNATAPVSSVVVVPLLVNDRPLGALYFTQEAPCGDFSNIQDALVGFVHAVTLVLNNKLSGQMDALHSMVNMAQSSFSSALPGAFLAPPPLDADDGDAGTTCDNTGTGSEDSTVPPLMALSGPSGRLSKISSKRLCTEAMLKVLQQEIRNSRRRSVELSFVADHLVIGEPIGHGGFGRVFRGTWHKRPAAVKVLNARGSDREAVSDAMEMAVLSSLQHPNIVQVFSCLTDMVEVGGSCPAGPLDSLGATRVEGASGSGSGGSSGGGTEGASARPRYRQLRACDPEDAPTYNIVVMEYCDRGTLADAVRKAGLFHQKLPSGAIGVDLASVIDILIELAGSLQYMHRVSLLHGDVKLDNILLKSDPLRPLGFVPKLADFGLTKIIRESEVVVNHSGAGTVTHLAPECFQAGTQITTSVDVYAFGILMWELYTGKRPYAGLTREAIMERVLRRGARPVFPAGAPAPYVELATACWSSIPAKRPPLGDVIGRLQTIADGMGGAPRATEAAEALRQREEARGQKQAQQAVRAAGEPRPGQGQRPPQLSPPPTPTQLPLLQAQGQQCTGGPDDSGGPAGTEPRSQGMAATPAPPSAAAAAAAGRPAGPALAPHPALGLAVAST